MLGFRRPAYQRSHSAEWSKTMRGTLLGAFCERGSEASTRCLELWAYPDTTLNLVINRVDAHGDVEYAFPCAPYQLVGVLLDQTFRTQSVSGVVVLSRDGDNVTASFTPATGTGGWQQSVSIEPFASALVTVAPEATRFAA